MIDHQTMVRSCLAGILIGVVWVIAILRDMQETLNSIRRGMNREPVMKPLDSRPP